MDNGSRKRLRILHTSDLHLTTLGDSACQSLTNLVDLAGQVEVDMVIIAGDLFDHNRVKDGLVSFAAEQLKRFAVDVVVLPGNHDCLMPGSAFKRAVLWQDCANVQVISELDGEMLDFPDLGVSLWGKPHDSYDHDVQPLAGIPHPRKNGYWHIAVAHGYYIDVEPPLHRSYYITEEEIVSSGWDYIALGHVTNFKCVCSEPVKAYYSGSPSVSGVLAIVDLAEETGVQVTCHSL